MKKMEDGEAPRGLGQDDQEHFERLFLCSDICILMIRSKQVNVVRILCSLEVLSRENVIYYLMRGSSKPGC